MSKSTVCPQCGGQVAPFDYVCDYCGNVMFENVKTTDNINQGTLSFDDGMGIIRENLDALHDIPKPSFGKTIKGALRILAALYTFGIVLIFWRRPKKRFNKDTYDKLKLIIQRNISFLKISSQGSNDLMARIQVYENELISTDKAIKQGIATKTFAYVLIFAIYIIWFIYIINLDPKTHATYAVLPYDSLVEGNLHEHIYISPDTCILSHLQSAKPYKWELQVKLILKKIESSAPENLKFDVYLMLADSKGIPVNGFEKAVLTDESKKNFRTQILNQSERADYYHFQLKNSADHYKYRDTVPVEAVRFIILADSVKAK